MSVIDTSHLVPGLPATPAEIRLQLAKILAAHRFRKTRMLSRFLSYVVESQLSGSGELLKEYTLGEAVFGRGTDFEPRIDNIVRVQARNLRARLTEYYTNEGTSDLILIQIDKGNYRPVFSSREQAPAPVSPDLPSVAVLPFATEAGSDDFSGGLTGDVIETLERFSELRVMGRHSSFALKGVEMETSALAARLGVGYVLKGAVETTKEIVRVKVQLADAANGQTWSNTYSRAVDGRVDLHCEISEGVRTVLQRSGQASDRTVSSAPSVARLRAYELYRKARDQWTQRSKPDFDAAITNYDEAIKADPTYAPAYCGLADCLILLAIYGYRPPAKIVPIAKDLALRSLELDESLAEANTTLGMIQSSYEWLHEDARNSYLRAIRNSPGSSAARQWYANLYLSTFGRFDEAIDQLRIALRHDPLSLTIEGDLANVLSLAGQHPEGIERCERAIAIQPRFFRPRWQLGLILERQGRSAEAIEQFSKAAEFSEGEPFGLAAIGSLAHALGVAGRLAEAGELIRRMETFAQHAPANPLSFCLAYLGTGEIDRALDWLELAVDYHQGAAIWMGIDPRGLRLHGNPRFQTLMDAVNLPFVD